MSLKQVTPDAVLRAVRTARRPPSTVDLASRFEVLPASPKLTEVLERLVAAGRLVPANPGGEPTCWAVAR